ncbi:putative T7SS-secreted protein [Streptomyces sp. NPDC045456]|uniref:putative T7SS-secreted protein n=1 Tax=Streptomyces sp. NPDC045456 TaxID=3155254 RepID=UPI0033C9D979
MAANPYPHLGWNPVPGISSEVSALQHKVSTAATALDNCHQQLQKLIGESSYWQGEAAEEFRKTVDGDLPTYLKNAAHSLQKTAKQLKNWDDHLTSHRDLAMKYDADAGEKKAAAEKAKSTYEAAGRHPDLKLANQQFPSQAEADAATARLRAAEKNMNDAATALTHANEAYQHVITKAKALESDHSEQAGTVAKSISEATDKLAPQQGFWSKVGDVIMDGLNLLKEHAGTIGAIAGLLALFPTPLTPIFAGIAIAASATSMSKNLSDPKFRDQLLGGGSGMDTFSAWASVGGDFLGMVPGGKALGTAAKEIGEGLKYADEVGVAVKNTEKITEFGREFGHVLKNAPRANVDEAWDAARASAGGSAKLLADISVNGINVAANVESSLESAGMTDKEGAGHNAAEFGKAGAGAYAVPEFVRSIVGAR